jgi:hypothetical protein
MLNFAKLLFMPDEPTEGDKGPDVDMPTQGMAEGMVEANKAADAEDAPPPDDEPAPPETPPGTPPPATDADKTDWKAKYDEELKSREEYAQKMAEEAYKQDAAKLASKSAILYEQIYGVKPPPGMFKDEPAPVDPKNPPNPQDALAKRLAEVENWRAQELKAREDYARQQKWEAERTVQAKRIYESMNKHKDIFDDPEMGDDLASLAVAKFTEALNANPKTANPDLIAEGIAKRFRAKIEAEKAKYVTGKKAAAKIPVGAGTGGRQAGTPVGKKTWEQLEKGFGDSLKAAVDGAEED